MNNITIESIAIAFDGQTDDAHGRMLLDNHIDGQGDLTGATAKTLAVSELDHANSNRQADDLGEPFNECTVVIRFSDGSTDQATAQS